MSEESSKAPKRRFRWGRLFAVVAFLGIAGGIAYGLSWLNARRYYLIVDTSEVRVGKGKMLPVGHVPFVPSDPALLKAYKAFPLPGGHGLRVGERRLDDRVELDQALFQILRDAAQHSLSRDNARTPELLSVYLERLRALPGINAEQRGLVERLAREALFVEARGHLSSAIELLDKAGAQFKESAEGTDRARQQQAVDRADRIGRALVILRSGAPKENKAPSSGLGADLGVPATSTTTGTISRP